MKTIMLLLVNLAITMVRRLRTMPNQHTFSLDLDKAVGFGSELGPSLDN